MNRSWFCLQWLLSASLILVFFIIIHKHNQSSNHDRSGIDERLSLHDTLHKILLNVTHNIDSISVRSVIDERNKLSRLLDRTVMRLNQMTCQSGDAISETGGWCNQAIKKEHLTDTPLIAALSRLFRGKTVASFGDGPGAYKAALKSSVQIYSAFDGSPFIENITGGEVSHLDLTIPQYGLGGWDYVMSLEVAEHIPVDYEDIFVSNVVRHAKFGVVLSWAVPGQGGFHHVNGKTDDWVKTKMKSLGFKFVEKDTKILRLAASYKWLKDNTNVFQRIGDTFQLDNT